MTTRIEDPLARLKKEDQDGRSELPGNAWAHVLLARHPRRPYTLDYLRLAFADFVELRGDRLYADDQAIVGGLASLDGVGTVMVMGHQKGRDTKENVLRRFGMARPEGFRKTARLMRHAEKLGIPVVTLVDIPGADPTLPAEERGQAFAIAESIMLMCALQVPIVATIIGEGGSGGALALCVADRVLMLQNAVYSVASPEAAASILWRDGNRGSDAAEAMRVTAPDMLRFGIIDAIVPEPEGGAHVDHAVAAATLKSALRDALLSVIDMPIDRLRQERANRYRSVGVFASV